MRFCFILDIALALLWAYLSSNKSQSDLIPHETINWRWIDNQNEDVNTVQYTGSATIGWLMDSNCTKGGFFEKNRASAGNIYLSNNHLKIKGKWTGDWLSEPVRKYYGRTGHDQTECDARGELTFTVTKGNTLPGPPQTMVIEFTNVSSLFNVILSRYGQLDENPELMYLWLALL